MIRDFLFGSVQLHILHQASQEPIFGLALLRGLRRHGYKLSPGTLYPLLHRMRDGGLLDRTDRVVQGKRRKYYTITEEGSRALADARPQIGELVQEILEGHGPTSIARLVERERAEEARRAEEERAELLARERAARVAAEEANLETAALLDATRQITSSLDLATTLDRILDTAVRLCEADIATVALLDADDMVLPHVSARGPQAHQVQRASFRVGEGLTGTVAQTRQVRNIPDVESDPLRLYRVVPKAAGMRSHILIPLCQRETVVGVLGVWSERLAHFVPARERLLCGLADQAALAIIHAREVAERQRATGAMRKSEERSRRLLENAMDLVSVVAADGTILYESPAADHVLGPNSSQERLGKNVFSFFHPEDVERVAAIFADFVQRPGAIERTTFRFRHGDGSWRVLEAIGHNLLTDPIIHGVIINSRDITERAQMEETLRLLAEASEELASSLDYGATLRNIARLAVPALADACLVDILGEDRSVRQVAVAHRDPAKEELLRELRQRYPIDPDWPHPVMKVLRTGKPELTPEPSRAWFETFAPDAEYLDLVAALVIESDLIVPLVVHGQTLGAMSFLSTGSGRRYGPADLVVAEGLAHRAALAIDNARLYREAQEAVRLRNEFLGLVVHDLKNPLGAIKDYAQLVQFLVSDLDSPKAQKAVDLVERIDRVVMQMVTQINELLDVAHLQIGQALALERQPVDLVGIARRKIAEHQRERTRYRVLVESELPELVGIWDGPRLERVLDNLLSNAVKYSPAGSDVVVRLAREASERETWAVLEIRDSGIGIPAADLPHIFDRFYRGSNVVGAIPGSGMGLNGVRQIVHQHGGTIAVASKEGRGTTVTVRLPQAPV